MQLRTLNDLGSLRKRRISMDEDGCSFRGEETIFISPSPLVLILGFSSKNHI